jgi:hypothetical protein
LSHSRIPVIVGHEQDDKVDGGRGLTHGQATRPRPIAVRTVAISERVSAQHGVFTCFGTDKDGLETLKSEHRSFGVCTSIRMQSAESKMSCGKQV